MRIGLASDAQGSDVQRLHRILIAAGQAIHREEVEIGQFGASTLAALQTFQRQHGLSPTQAVDEATLAVLINVEKTINITINEGGGPTPPPPGPDQQHGIVNGQLVDQDGGPIQHVKVDLFSLEVRREVRLGEAMTDASGRFRFTYQRPQPLNLLVRAYDSAGTVIASSRTVFRAPTQTEIDLTTAKDGVVRSPSQFTTVYASATAALHGTKLLDLKQNKDAHELSFLADAIGVDSDQVAYLYISAALAEKHDLRPETFFGLFVQGIPPALKSAL